MLSISLDPDTERRLAQIAKLTGHSKNYLAQELIVGNLDDLEDRCVAESRLKKRGPSLTSHQLREALGLPH